MGDNPALQQSQISKTTPEKHTVIEVEDRRLEALFPLVTVQHCPTCRFREMYFIDGWDGKRARLKSFERGHLEKNSVAVRP